MGMWWDCRSNHQRLWLYGANFIYMLDLARDLDPSADTANSRKRKVGMLGNHVIEAPEGHELVKVEDEEIEKKKKQRRQNTGAGSEMKENQKYGVQMRKIDWDGEEAGLLSPPQSIKDDIDEDEDEDEEMIDYEDEEGAAEADALVISRRKAQSDHTLTHNDKNTIEDNEDEQQSSTPTGDDTVVRDKTEEVPSAASWHTFQYRGIFGICALNQEFSPNADINAAGSEESVPEVVIVERPLYDVELLPRFTSGQDW